MPRVRKRLYKTEGKDAMLFGVCGGLAEYFDIDPTLIRVGAAFLVLAVGTGVMAYLVCALVMPNKSDIYPNL